LLEGGFGEGCGGAAGGALFLREGGGGHGVEGGSRGRAVSSIQNELFFLENAEWGIRNGADGSDGLDGSFLAGGLGVW
jgi:hypothetical protein